MGRELSGLSAYLNGGDIGTGRDGELLQAWDLFVGQKIDVLGKPTTLMQANHGTLMWLEYHARRLLKKALELENEIMQFKPIPDIVHRMLNTRVSLSPSSSSSALPSPSRPARIAPMCSSSARVGRRQAMCGLRALRRQCVKQCVKQCVCVCVKQCVKQCVCVCVKQCVKALCQADGAHAQDHTTTCGRTTRPHAHAQLCIGPAARAHDRD